MEYFEMFMDRFCSFKEANNVLKNSYDAILTQNQARSIMHEHLNIYKYKDSIDYKKLSADMLEINKLTKVPEYTATLIFYILATEHLEKLYQKKGLPQAMYDDAVKDLYYKMNECFEVKGAYGTLSTQWHSLFFALKIFTLGRLQFEPNVWSEKPGEYNGICNIKPGEPILYTHIPSSGKLNAEDCIDSFKRAYDFFPQLKRNGILPIACHSWLLEPALREILAPTSNIRKFNELFNIVYVDDYVKFHDAWRVFYSDAAKPPTEWREDTSLRRVLKKFTLEGNIVRAAIGVLFFDGEKIINM